MSKNSVKLSSDGLKKVESAIKEKNFTQRDIAEKTALALKTVNVFLKGQLVTLKITEKILNLLDLDDLENLLEQEYIINIGSDGIDISGKNFSINTAAQELSETTTDDVQGIASAQLKILDSYHREVLTQAKSSFRWALIISGAGFIFFLASIILVLDQQQKDKALIPLISGAIIEIIAGVNFYLYGQTAKQLSSFYRKLDRTQRFLLANSICESLEGDVKQTTRSELVKTVTDLTKE